MIQLVSQGEGEVVLKAFTSFKTDRIESVYSVYLQRERGTLFMGIDVVGLKVCTLVTWQFVYVLFMHSLFL